MSAAATPAADRQASSPNLPLLLHEFFERAARRWPTRTALDIPPGRGRPDRCLATYGELDRRSSRFARLLRPFIAGESLAAILLPRHSALLYASQLAVLKAGAAFVCLDPAFPEARVREILEDSAAVVLLTDASGAKCAGGSTSWGGRVCNVADWAGQEPSDAGIAVHPPWLTPESLAYVIYTSGSTGHPKGVMLEHRSIANLVASDIEEFGLTPDARVAQTSSHAYDSAIEETWLALAAGAALVVADDDDVRLGPDLVDWLRRERIAVLCPTPTLLRATGCENPEKELPGLSLVYAGGEALPEDVANRWAAGRRLENGYGPTECAVTALRGTIRPGEPVSIGRPIRGLEARALDDSQEEAASGEWGELCIGGAGLARGYWRRPELTAEKFVCHPRFGRIYRTGDLVHRRPDGSFAYHGRADAQVKIRGYRVELEEIEARMAACAGVRLAACSLQDDEGGGQTLAAFIVPEDPGAPPSVGAIQSSLRAALPSYMVPGRVGFLAALPLTAGGKLDRAALPRIEAQARQERAIAAPRNPLEARVVEAFRDVLGLDHAVSIDADFFTALGGDSLRAAQLITRLRQSDASTSVAVRDLYETRTAAGLAGRCQTAAGGTEPPAAPSPSSGRPLLATLIQSAWLLAGLCVSAATAYLMVFVCIPWIARGLGLLPLLLLGPVFPPAALALYAFIAVRAAVGAKRLFIGRYHPLRAPAWGSFYVRNWIVQRAVHAIPWWLIEGTGLQLTVLRALGARIGRRVQIHHGVDLRQGGWDLLEIGDDVSIGQEAFLGLVELEDGQIVVSPVSLGDGATVETRGMVGGGGRLEPGAFLTTLSALPGGGRIPAGQRWDGVPAAPSGESPPRPDPAPGARDLSPFQSDLCLALARYAVAVIPSVIPGMLAVLAVAALRLDAGRVLAWLDEPSLAVKPVMAGLAALTLSVPLSLTLEAFIARALGPVKEGVISRWSWPYVRVWLKTELARAAGSWLAGSLFWPVWLRWAGAKVGRGCEISTVVDIVPELIEIGAGSFLADGIYLGGPRLHRGTVTLAATRLGRSTFLGNHVVIPAGQRLPDDILLGVCTVAGAGAERNVGAWFGHPAFELPRREVVEADGRLTYQPSPIRYLTRLFWELLRLTLPVPPTLAVLAWIEVVARAPAAAASPAFFLGLLPLASLGAAASLCLLALAVKWLLLGRVRPGQHPFWACWCGRWDFVYVTWEFWARGPLSALEGTLLLSWYLRAMGMKLGKRVLLGPGMTQQVDPDMLIVEDGATVSAMFQAHTFEDRVLKIDRIHIRARATLGAATVPLYGADVGPGTAVAPGSVIMKHERLRPGVRYEGAPAREIPGILDRDPRRI